MKHVLHLIDTTGPGGAETIFLTLVDRMGPPDWKAYPVVQGPGWVMDELIRRGHEPIVLGSEGSFDLRYLRRLRTLLRRCRIDLVHAHLSTTALYGGLAARSMGIPALATYHGTPDLSVERPRDRIRHHLIRGANERVVLVSRSLRDLALRRGLLGPRQAEVIHNGVDVDHFSPGSEPALRSELAAPDEILVGAVGNVRLLKDYPTFLRTAGELERRKPGRFRFVVAGATNSPIYEELLALRSELGLEERVTFLGFRPDVAALLRCLDVFLLTSSEEGFSLVTVQAMATGVPVVATRSGGPEEIVTDGVTGLLVPVRSPAITAEAVLSVMGDRSSRDAIARAGRRAALERFSRQAMVQAYEQLYRRSCKLAVAANPPSGSVS